MKLWNWIKRVFDRKEPPPQPKEPCHILSSSADVGAYTPALTYSDSPNRELQFGGSPKLKRLEAKVQFHKEKMDQAMIELVKFHFSATKK